ncbi:centromere protein F [Hoplias malabaricus]|uniref:centromere protein F n=1 Tax=Hoplias malabaricus TaxID=27720 RepID=UPI003462CC1B
MATFVAHPSVRIRGTEHSYIPVLCQDEKCDGREKGVHMHCPLCTVGEVYQDPVILRAHFRIKHVDKGIDFAGLKVLRCCNHCEIVGTIKGEKRFKGAHWHCYRCRNGFNRRDEAIKHYKTHFRNPHTTFQIQVTQDVNCRQYYSGTPEAQVKAYSGLAISLDSCVDAAATAVGSIVAQPILTTSDTEASTLLTDEPKEDSESNGIPLGAEEEVGSSQHASERTQMLVLMDPDRQTGNLIYDEATGLITEQSLDFEKRLLELNQQIDTLRQEKESMEKTLKAEIKQLKEQVVSLVQSNVKMYEELQAYQCPEQSQNRVAKLMESLQAQHKELLEAQLASLRHELNPQTSVLPLNGHTEATELRAKAEESQAQAKGETALPGLEVVDVQLQPQQEELRGHLLEDDTLSGIIVPRSDTALADTSQDMDAKQDVPVVSRKRSSEDDCGGTSDIKVSRVS